LGGIFGATGQNLVTEIDHDLPSFYESKNFFLTPYVQAAQFTGLSASGTGGLAD
jgi:hypothetical protein